MIIRRLASLQAKAKDCSACSAGSACEGSDPELDSGPVRSSTSLQESDMLKPCARRIQQVKVGGPEPSSESVPLTTQRPRVSKAQQPHS